jgi:site-specific recombinase XerD
MTTTSDPANDALLESWDLSLHDKSPRTRILYNDEARRFAAWLHAHDRPAAAVGDLLAVTRTDVEAWLSDLRAAGLSANTVRSRWVVLRNLYGWATDEEELDRNPMEKIIVSKPSLPPMKLLTDDELRALFRACEGRDFVDRRDLALVRTLAATGMRVSEVCAMADDDLDLRNRRILVRHGKGDRARLVRFDPETAQALDRYRRVRARHRLAGLAAFWLGNRGPLTRKGVPGILDKRTELAGIQHVNPHMLRHSWADRAKAAGMTDSDLQQLGGWENAAVMSRYGSARAADRALEAYDRSNPMEGL